MPEYRGIVNPAEVKATPVFDWNTVIQDVQKSVIDSEANRQASRDKLEKDTNDTLTSISKVTLGKDEAMNKKLTDAAYNFKGAVGDYAKLVREGKASQKDFNMFNQNAMDTFSQINAVGKNAKAAYDSYISESKAGNLSAASDYLAEQLGLAMSLKDKDIIMDPKSGRGFIAGKEDGDVVDVNWLNNERNLLVPKVKLDAIMDANVDKIGKYALIGKVTSSGILSTDDAKERKGYEDYRKSVANGVISDPIGALSVLTDYGDVNGIRYTPTINKTEAESDKTGTKIFMQLNSAGSPEPVFTDEQLKAASKIIENQVDQRVNVITTQVENVYRRPVFAPREPRVSGYKAGEEPVLSAPAYINKTTTSGGVKNTGTVIGVENVRIKKSGSEDEVINNFGVDNGKFFMKYTRYTGKEGLRDKESGYFTSSAQKKVLTLSGDKDASNINAKLALIPNPDTGENFKGIDEARQYIRLHSQSTPKKIQFDANGNIIK